jgi:hypothetical protein
MHVYFKSENGSYLPNSPSPLSGFLQACGQSIMLGYVWGAFHSKNPLHFAKEPVKNLVQFG